MNNKEYNSCRQMVSVIVPVRNGEKTIEKLIKALLAQDYPKDQIQIIIVDNNSQDQTRKIVKKHPVILEQENRVDSSYAARNKGLSLAQGEIIAFTDADCIPEKNWISEAVRALDEENADMAGGRISFIFSVRKSAAEYFDSTRFMNNERYIKNKQGAVTANLFVRARVFNQMGMFPEVQSGGDTQWTSKALKDGFSLIYTPRAIVQHPARKLPEILKKYWRVSSISGYEEGEPVQKQLSSTKTKNDYLKKIYFIIRLLIPVPSGEIIKSLTANQVNREAEINYFAVWCVSYLCQLIYFVALVRNIFIKKIRILKRSFFEKK
jgi:glycosyltransferase involved in cell wall biosynthesis